MRIIRGTDPIEVPHPVVLIYSEPGLLKTTLGYGAAEDAATLDFDKGAHRAKNRKDTYQPDTWADVEQFLSHEAQKHSALSVDTVGRCLDLMAMDIIEGAPKLGRDGVLTQQGWGVLKGRYKAFMLRLNQLGKDVVLFAHAKEDKDDDKRIIRPDIQGGSYGEVMKSADLVGYAYMSGKDRILDFNPSDKWFGKNPCGWSPFKVPHYEKEPLFLQGVIDKAREALGKLSQEGQEAAKVVADWRAAIEGYADLDAINSALPKVLALKPVIVQAQVKKLLHERAKALGLIFDADKKQYVAAKAA